MSWNNFYKRVADIEFKRQKAIWISPELDKLPLPIQRFDEPFFPLSKSIIRTTTSNVGVYIFNFAAFLATGAAGIVALERSIAYALDTAIVILHGPFSGSQYTVLADEISFTISALTVTSKANLDFYLDNPPYSAFLWTDSSIDSADIERGGIMNHEKLSLRNTDFPSIDMSIITMSDLLVDLSDTYINAMKQRVQ